MKMSLDSKTYFYFCVFPKINSKHFWCLSKLYYKRNKISAQKSTLKEKKKQFCKHTNTKTALYVKFKNILSLWKCLNAYINVKNVIIFKAFQYKSFLKQVLLHFNLQENKTLPTPSNCTRG